jgi:hypothetical protein
MNRYLKVFSVVVILLAAGCAGKSKYMRTAIPPAEGSPAGKAMVYFLRPSGLGYAVHFQIWDYYKSDYKLIGLSQAKSYFVYECDPGKHLFIGFAENKRAVAADIEAGKSYYIITQVKMGGWKARMAFIPVTRESEFWNQVDSYKKGLHFIVPEKEVIAQWESAKKDKIQKELNEVINYLNTPEGNEYIVELEQKDGR